MKLMPSIYTNGGEASQNAVEMYMEAFGLTLGYHAANNENSWKAEYSVEEDENPETLTGYFHADLMRDGEHIMSVSSEGDNSDAFRDVTFLELGMKMGSEDAVKKAVSVLSEGKIPPGSAVWNSCTATVTDRFNVTWCISV